MIPPNETSRANHDRLRRRQQSRDGWLSVGVCDLNVSGGKTGHQLGLARDRPFVAVLYSVEVCALKSGTMIDELLVRMALFAMATTPRHLPVSDAPLRVSSIQMLLDASVRVI